MENKNTLRKNLANIIARAGLSLGIIFTLNTTGCEYYTKTQKPEQYTKTQKPEQYTKTQEPKQKSSQDYIGDSLFYHHTFSDAELSFLRYMKEKEEKYKRIFNDPNFLKSLKQKLP